VKGMKGCTEKENLVKKIVDLYKKDKDSIRARVLMKAFDELEPLAELYKDAFKPENIKSVYGKTMLDELHDSKLSISNEGFVTISIQKGYYIKNEKSMTFPLSLLKDKSLQYIIF
jgi:hypothetical protein